MSTLLLSLLEGLRWLVIRNVVTILSGMIALVAVLILIPRYGIVGFGLAYTVLGATQCILAAITLSVAGRRAHHSRQTSGTSVRSIATLLWRENIQLSLIAVIQLCFEPITKFLLANVGTLPDIASFELALRVCTQVRVFFQAALQPLLAIGARLGGPLTETMRQQFDQARHYVGAAGGGLLCAQLAAAPIVAIAGLGHVELKFLEFYGLLVVANTMAASGLVGYYIGLGLVGGWTLASFGVAFAYAATYTFTGVRLMQVELARSALTVGGYIAMLWGWAPPVFAAAYTAWLIFCRINGSVPGSNVEVLVCSFAAVCIASVIGLIRLFRVSSSSSVVRGRHSR
jgi:hypothetical protein